MQQLSRILPAQARIRNRFSVHVILTSDLLAALNQITLDHHALHQLLNIPGNISAVKHFFHNTDLLLKLLVRIRMIRIHDRRRILQIPLIIFFQQELQILIMIVRDRIAMFIQNSASQTDPRWLDFSYPPEHPYRLLPYDAADSPQSELQ